MYTNNNLVSFTYFLRPIVVIRAEYEGTCSDNKNA